jgi:hypothetical protein
VVPAGFAMQTNNSQGLSGRTASEADLLALLQLLRSQQGLTSCNNAAPAQGIAPAQCGAQGTGALGTGALGTGALGSAAQGMSPPAAGAQGAPAPGSNVDARLARMQAEIDELRVRVQEHTTAIAEVIARDPELRKKYQVNP